MLEHRYAKALAFWTFLLLIVGGAVNATGSSLACPEPSLVCHGQLFPPMKGGVFYEHGHRLWAESVGLLQLGLTILLLVRRPAMKRVAWIALAMVSVQATLGAITVAVKLSPWVSSGHLLLGMSYFATLIYIAFRTAPAGWDDARRERARAVPEARKWIRIGAIVVFAQLAIGAAVRHLGAALVCLGMPTCTRTGVWFPGAGVQYLHMLHRAFGCVVAIVTTIAAVKVWRAATSWPALRRLAMIAPAIVALQIALGVMVVLTMRSVPIAVLHFAGAESLWALWMSMFLMTSPRALVASVDAPVQVALP